MEAFGDLARTLSEALAHTGPYAPFILFFGSFVEYVFPPFPGDTLVLLGAWYAVNGQLSWTVTLLSATAGAVAGAWLDYRVGAALGRRLDERAERRGPLSAERLRRLEESYRKWGALLLVANRFLPGVRAFLFVGAGAARIPLGEVLLYGGISAALWNALLLAAGALLVRNLGELSELAARYTSFAWVALGVLAGGLALGAAWAARGRRRGR